MIKKTGKIVWLGSYQSEESFKNAPARTIGQASGYTSQKGFIKGIDLVLPDSYVLDTVGCISYPSYPTYPSIIIKNEKWKRTDQSYDVTAGYLNFPYINHYFQGQSQKRELNKWKKARLSQNDECVIFIYGPSASKLEMAMALKKQGARVYVIIPDIPELVNLGANKIVRFAKNREAARIKKLFKDVDGFILYSACMADYYELPQSKWIQVEGVFDTDEERTMTESGTHPIRLMYCGALDEFRGIPQLLDAFDELRDKDYELWLTGAGRSDGLIAERAKRDKRIHHFGYLDSRDQVIDLENQADILIHTRDVTSPAAPYCFPSKLFEYLATAKPVISVRIPGIPQEYYDYLYPLDAMSKAEIKRSIQSVLATEKEELESRGRAGRAYILENKNSKTQAARILEFAGVV